jgi:REP element-mobilizing transposase RayT
MARKHRDKAAGAFHVYAHSVWAAAELYRDDRDRLTFLHELARTVAKAEWRCLAFCLLHSHYHLLLEVDDGTLPVGMHSLNFRYAAKFNARHHMKGHAFAARYGSRRIDDDADLLNAYRYVVRNPVEARLCESAVAWPWGSYPGTVGVAAPASFVEARKIVSCFDGQYETGLARLRTFVERE